MFIAGIKPFILSLSTGLVLSCLSFKGLAYGQKDSAGFVGSQQCASCHEKQWKDWQDSDHFRAMNHATSEYVLADFDSGPVSFHQASYQFEKQNDQFFILVTEKGEPQSRFEVLFTFGHYPLQQYLVDIGKGHLQALNLAWDSRPKKEGGQRWFHLQPTENINSGHPFHWQQRFQNWNSRCAECHSTNLEKNYSAVDDVYDTSWSEINVACEACHGPGAEHVELMSSPEEKQQAFSGFAFSIKQGVLNWSFDKDDPIARPSGKKNEVHIDRCGGCHARRQLIADPNTFDGFHDTYRLQTIDQGLYFDDGQILDEVYVLGSFMQSKMHQAGVTCVNCHNPHSGKLIAEPNQVCAQCHQPSHFDSQQHTFHIESTRPQCVDCHMPERTYMGVDPRRDHSFSIPRPALAKHSDVPLACLSCHKDQSADWAESVFDKLKIQPVEPSWISAHQAAAKLDPAALRPLYREIMDDDLPPILRATMLKHLAQFPSREAVDAIQKKLRSENPIERTAAVSSTGFLDAETRWSLLESHIKDNSRSVRFEVATQLSTVYRALGADRIQRLQGLLNEYRQALAATSDMPGSQLALAELELALGNTSAAERAYQQAIFLVPAFVPALLNYSNFLRLNGRLEDERKQLEQALQYVPESAAVQHAMGLYHVRDKQYDLALPYLKKAVFGEGASPRFAYVYAVALDSTGDTQAAIGVLVEADKRWPKQVESLFALVSYLQKANRENEIPRYLRTLNALAPRNAQVQQWIQRYGMF